MPKRLWTKEEEQKLKALCDAKKTLKHIMSALPDKTAVQIYHKCEALNLNFKKQRQYWTDDEKQAFKNDWQDSSISIPQLRRRYKNRSYIALSRQAKRMKLPKRSYDNSYLTVRDITTEMQVSKDRVRTWLKHGLKYHNSNIKPYKYLIDESDLLKFLENNPSFYDASKISSYLFNPEPQWLKTKRFKDAENFRTRSKKSEYYSNNECIQIINMFKQNKSNAEIAKALNRTESGIERMLALLNCSRKHYNQYELDILYKYHDQIHLDELVKMLPLRTRNGIIHKCQQLKLKYINTKNKK